MIRAAFFDIDGTLLSHRTNSVPESTFSAIEQLHKKGILVFAATGRHMSVLKELKPLDGIRFNGAITLNGQLCCNEDRIIYDNPIDKDAIKALQAYLESHPLACGFVEEKQIYVNFYNDTLYRVHAAIHTPLPPLGDLSRGCEHNIYQVILYGTDEDISKLPSFPNTTITRWHYGGIDMIPSDGGKAVGIRKVLELYGISPEEAIAFGDGDNDIDMLHAVGIGVAMGNAGDSVKQQSDYVTDSVDDDGILHALEHFGIL